MWIVVCMVMVIVMGKVCFEDVRKIIVWGGG